MQYLSTFVLEQKITYESVLPVVGVHADIFGTTCEGIVDGRYIKCVFIGGEHFKGCSCRMITENCDGTIYLKSGDPSLEGISKERLCYDADD
jgi:hypothetical protein